MVNLRQAVLTILAPLLLQPNNVEENIHSPTKSVAIVGAGSAGLAVLKSLLDLPLDVRNNWEIVLYEQRRNVGGIWLPDPNPANPPNLPETPLYPLLHTNTPVPTMTYPGFPFPPNTPLFPSHEYVERYHHDFFEQNDMTSYVLLNHTVLSSSWAGNSTDGAWNVVVRDHNDKTIFKTHDHLVVANGHNHYPRVPRFVGQEDWLENSSQGEPKREILHSIWYRSEERYTNCTVLVVGSGASGKDVASQVSTTARRAYHSVHHPLATTGSAISKPDISHFTSTAVVFVDGSVVEDIDAVILGTGYEFRIPFLEDAGELAVVPKAHSNETYEEGLVTNLRYIFPLHQQIFSLSPFYPTNALSFIGLPILVANCPSDAAQAIYAAHIIANASLLPNRKELLQQLTAYEEDMNSRGFDPYHVGHHMVNGSTFDYQDELLDYLKQRGVLPADGKKFVEGWRRRSATYQYVKRGWNRVKELGTQDEWLDGVETEEQWADLMERMNNWQAEWENKHGINCPAEQTLF